MHTVVLGAGALGVATAHYLSRLGHRVTVIERQPGAALETSFGNGAVIHASEVEPWSRPGMPLKILKWLGREDAPMLLRLRALLLLEAEVLAAEALVLHRLFSAATGGSLPAGVPPYAPVPRSGRTPNSLP